MKKYKTKILLVVILGIALFFRLVGLNWDQNHHLHPDERFLTMVTGAVSWPSSLVEYFDPTQSKLNPYNNNYNFFVYGTLPMKMVKFFAQLIIFDQYDYNNITLVGRLSSAMFDMGVLILVFLICKNLFSQRVALIACFFYAVSVLPIQLSHFYAVDTFAVFFTTLCFYFLIKLFVSRKLSYLNIILLSVAFSLALACKASALFLLPFILLAFVFSVFVNKNFTKHIFLFFLFLFVSYVSFRIADPRVFSSAEFLKFELNPQFVSNIKQLQSFNNPEAAFPPAVQWIKTKPIIFPLKNMVLWGFGLPLAIVLIAGLLYSIFYFTFYMVKMFGKKNSQRFLKLSRQNFYHLLIVFWVCVIFFYQGIQFVKAMRYFYPLYPFLVILAANFTNKLWKKYPSLPLHIIYIFLILLYPISFLSIYFKPHSRIQASQWIYNNIPKKSVLSCEHWDDCLPLGLPGKNSNVFQYKTLMLEMYNKDTDLKWQKINNQLDEIDYLILSSNRLWGSIQTVPERYPQSAKFYQDLLSDKLNFKKVADITSNPCFPPVGKALFCFDSSYSDETFTVYDHPKVLIFEKKK